MVSEEARQADAAKAIASWRRNRLLYPGWIVLPHQNRDTLWERTRFWVPRILELVPGLHPAEQVVWLHELAWRWDRCLLPWPDDMAELVQHILREIGNLSSDKPQDQLSRLPREVSYLRQGLIRYLREEQQVQHFEVAISSLQSEGGDVADWRAFASHQQALAGLESWDFDAALIAVSGDWTSNDPIWKVRRASIWAELGNLDEAHNLAMSALRDARGGILEVGRSGDPKGNPIAAKASQYSREGHARLCLRYIDLGRRLIMPEPKSYGGELCHGKVV